MPSDYTNVQIGDSLNRLGKARAAEAIALQGMALPSTVVAVDGGMVTVKFEVATPQRDDKQKISLPQITIPKAEAQWMRAPTQVGDHGMTVPAGTFLGAMSGISTTVADLDSDYGNLGATLVWVPIRSVNDPAAPDPAKAWVNGPQGVVLSDTAETIALIIDKATATIQMAGSGTASGDALIRKSDLQAALTAFASILMTWGAAHFSSGSSSPPAPSTPTVTGSTKSFSA